MAIWRTPHVKKLVLFWLGVAAGSLAVVILVISAFVNSLIVQFLSLLMAIIAAGMIRASAADRQPDLRKTEYRSSTTVHAYRNRFAWVLGAASMVIVVISYFLMWFYGYSQAWPVYIFAASGFVGSIIWGYILVRWMNR